MKISTRMTSTCRDRTLTPRDESLSGICVSEKTPPKWVFGDTNDFIFVLICCHRASNESVKRGTEWSTSSWHDQQSVFVSLSHSTWGIWIQTRPIMIRRLALWERILMQTLAWILMSEWLKLHIIQHILWGLSLNCFWPVLSNRVGYAGDNFARYSGDTITMAQTQCES